MASDTAAIDIVQRNAVCFWWFRYCCFQHLVEERKEAWHQSRLVAGFQHRYQPSLCSLICNIWFMRLGRLSTEYYHYVTVPLQPHSFLTFKHRVLAIVQQAKAGIRELLPRWIPSIHACARVYNQIETVQRAAGGASFPSD